MRKRVVTLALCAALLAGCATVPDASPESSPVPSEAPSVRSEASVEALNEKELQTLLQLLPNPNALEPGVFGDGATIYLLLYGSSSCPPAPVSVATSPEWVVTLSDFASGPCTADYAPSAFALVPTGRGVFPSQVQVLQEDNDTTYAVTPLRAPLP